MFVFKKNYCRVLKTPTEEIWKGVSSLPDYKVTFPKWNNYNLQAQVSNLDGDGFHLLEQMLIYDPAKRISALAIADHPYFRNLRKDITPNFEGMRLS